MKFGDQYLLWFICPPVVNPYCSLQNHSISFGSLWDGVDPATGIYHSSSWLQQQLMEGSLPEELLKLLVTHFLQGLHTAVVQRVGTSLCTLKALLSMNQFRHLCGQSLMCKAFTWIFSLLLHQPLYLCQRQEGKQLQVSFHAGVRLPEKELVEFKGRCLVSVEPHCIACSLPQLVPNRAGHQRDGQAIHLLTTYSSALFSLDCTLWRLSMVPILKCLPASDRNSTTPQSLYQLRLFSIVTVPSFLELS